MKTKLIKLAVLLQSLCLIFTATKATASYGYQSGQSSRSSSPFATFPAAIHSTSYHAIKQPVATMIAVPLAPRPSIIPAATFLAPAPPVIARKIISNPQPLPEPVPLPEPEHTGACGAQPGATCVQYFRCKSRQARSPASPNTLCLLPNGFTGICCRAETASIVKAETNSETIILGSVPYGTPLVNLSDQYRRENNHHHHPSIAASYPSENIEIDLHQVQHQMDELSTIEKTLSEKHISVLIGTTAFSQQAFSGGSDTGTLSEAKAAFNALIAFRLFAAQHRMSPEDIASSELDLAHTNVAETCSPKPVCMPQAAYRTADGSCNNLRKTAQGKAISVFARLLPSEYRDGITEPRQATDGTPLPNTRLISITISPDARIQNDRYSLMLMQFGQFVDHDLTRTPLVKTNTGESITCCNDNATTRWMHPSCFAIEIPAQDDFFNSHNQRCIDFVRSAPAINPVCRFGPREQMNQISSYLDGNNVYGSSKQEADRLREFVHGRLRVSRINEEDFLPLNSNDSSCLLPKQSTMKCFLAGDGRANEVTDLTVLHNAWLREHNRIVDVLMQLNPSWDDETAYQETRRIVIAQLQHIIYREFLPLIIGDRAIAHFGLALSEDYSDAYDDQLDATIVNEFATAAYRLHSLVAGSLNIRNALGDLVEAEIRLRNQFFQPSLLYEQGGYDMRIAGLTGQAIQSFDNFFTRELTNHLFQVPGKKFGLDLVALNIQRGRDHGIAGYIKYRELCGLSVPQSFDDLKRIFSNSEVPDVMSQLYDSVRDIDLFIAGTSERHMPGAVVGPTFACIIGEQFRRLKVGDRFWYENSGQVGSFTRRQLAQIKRASLARVLCDNSAIVRMQPYALLMPNDRNPKVSCDSDDIPRLDLSAWRTNQE